MVKDTKRAKTESLSLRLDPKTKFCLEFAARVNGQSITVVVERAIKKAAEEAVLSSSNEEGGWDSGDKKNWLTYWDANEGFRTLKLITDADYSTTFEEDELKSFTVLHWQFFYISGDCKNPRRSYLEILWPKLSTYLKIWEERRAENYWAAGEAMRHDLRAAKVAAPMWPPETKLTPAKPVPKISRDEMDDEIPF